MAQIPENNLEPVLSKYERAPISAAKNSSRSLEFQKVGSSEWLAPTTSHAHPSGQSTVEDEYDPPEIPGTNINLAWTQAFESIADPIITDQCP